MCSISLSWLICDVICSRANSKCILKSFIPILTEIFEIPATGQLLLLNDGMEVHMQNLCFVPGVHYIGYNEKNMENTIEVILSGNFRQKIMEIRVNGQNLIQKILITKARAIQLTNIGLTNIGHCISRNKHHLQK
jgi:hypothetical protein